MSIAAKKELTPVVYNESSVKVLSLNFDSSIPGFTQHWHDRIELHLVKSGVLELICNGEEVQVHPGELSIISPTFSHLGLPSKNGVEYFVIMFDIKNLFNNTVSTGSYLEPIINGEVCFKYKTDLKEIVSLAENIVEMSSKESEYHSLEIIGSLYKLLGLLLKHCVDTSLSKAHIGENFDNVLNYINANLKSRLSIEEISKTLGYERSYFCRKFKKITGVTATEYIRLARLEEAREMLEKTRKSIMDIAISCGFNDSAYFINCFKKVFGISPSKYRKSAKKQ